MTAAGLIFSNLNHSVLPELTHQRTLASVPFGCRYRLIDFALSSMVNAGINAIGIVTHYNYQSLMDHIGTGKDWDLARRSGGIHLLPPFVAAYENAAAGKLFHTRLESLIGERNFIQRRKEEFFVLADCDAVCCPKLDDVIRAHVESNADITVVTKKLDAVQANFQNPVTLIQADESGRITGVSTDHPIIGEVEVSTNILVMRRSYLLGLIHRASVYGYRHLYTDVIARELERSNFRVYRMDGFYARLDTLKNYFQTSMRLLNPADRKDLFGQRGNAVYTKVRNSAPTKFEEGAKVTNSLLADGCVIEGTVENSILFRGVNVGKGTVVRNSILLQDTYTGSGVSLNYVVADKDVLIKDGRTLSGCEQLPFFLNKGTVI